VPGEVGTQRLQLTAPDAASIHPQAQGFVADKRCRANSGIDGCLLGQGETEFIREDEHAALLREARSLVWDALYANTRPAQDGIRTRVCHPIPRRWSLKERSPGFPIGPAAVQGL